ncbi:protein-L-isoaspartate O-methyltransferase [Cribrihabitans sp. XS_ASV171]
MTDFAARRRMMVDTQVRPSDVTKFPIIDAMLKVAREPFVPNAQREAAYADQLISLGGGRYMLEPRTLAKMLDWLNIGLDDSVLDIGSGYGYSAAVAAHMSQFVVAVEEDEAMADEAQEILSEISADNAIVHCGPLAGGAPEHGPYDVIMIQGGVEEVPQALLDQLKEGGRIVCIFMEDNLGTVRVGYANSGQITWRFAFNAGAPILHGFEKRRSFAL